MKINWNPEKNELLKEIREISFEQIDNYPVAVPFVIQEDGSWFLKTAYKNRKLKGVF